MIGHGLPVALSGMASAAQFRRQVARSGWTCIGQAQQAFPVAQLLHLAPSPFEKLIRKEEYRFDIPLDIEVIVDIGLAQCQFIGGQEHLAQCPRVLQDNCETGGFTCC